MEALLITLLEWLSKPMEFESGSIEPPRVEQLDAEALTREAYRDYPGLLPDSGIDQRVLALYSWDSNPHGIIYILDASLTEGIQEGESPLENPVFQERLLHELVHHVQYKTGQYDRFPCKNAGEKQAYLLGGQYLKQRHANDPLPNRTVLAHIYSRC